MSVAPAPAVSVTWDSAPVRQQFGDCRVVFDGVAVVGFKEYRVNVTATRGARKPEITLRYTGKRRGTAVPESHLADVRAEIILAATLHLKPMRDAIIVACREGRESEIVSPATLPELMADALAPVDPDRDITENGVTSGLTGPDWEPSADMRFFAQSTDNDMLMAFGATREAALAKLASEGGEPVSRAPVDPAPVRLRQLRGPDGQSVLVASPAPACPPLAVMVANTTRACYWRTETGFYIATGPDCRAPVDTGAGYARLDSLMRLKGESEGTINAAIDAMGEPAPVDPVPALGEIGIASIRRALTLAHGALSPANNSEERQALAAIDVALSLPAIRQGGK